jgi:hypothetical protein
MRANCSLGRRFLARQNFFLPPFQEFIERRHAASSIVETIDPCQNCVEAALRQAFRRKFSLRAENRVTPNSPHGAVWPDYVLSVSADPLVVLLAG